MPSSTPPAGREIGIRPEPAILDRPRPAHSSAWAAEAAEQDGDSITTYRDTGLAPYQNTGLAPCRATAGVTCRDGGLAPCRDAGDGPRATAPAPGSHHLLFLALFLLLGGVFALLTSYARLDQDKIDRVLASLEERFGGGALGLPLERERVGDPQAAGLDTPALPDPRREERPPLLKGRGEGGSELRLDEDRLFDRDGRIPRARWVLLSRFARAAREEGMRIAVLAPAPVPPETLGGARLERLGRLRARLVALGAPEDAVLLGVGDGRVRRWRVMLWPGARGPAAGVAGDGAP